MKCRNCDEDPCRGPRDPSNKDRFQVGQVVRPTAHAVATLQSQFFSRDPQTIVAVMNTTDCGTTGQHIKTNEHGWSDAFWFEEDEAVDGEIATEAAKAEAAAKGDRDALIAKQEQEIARLKKALEEINEREGGCDPIAREALGLPAFRG